MKYKNGEEFINKLYQDMHISDIVMHKAEKSDSPEEKIAKYMNRLEIVHEQAKENKHKMDLLKELYYQKYVIKKLPKSYINLQKRIIEEEGRDNIEITEDWEQDLLDIVQNDQKSSINRWLEYFTSDDAMYPMWFKYYAFQGMLKLGKYDKKLGKFGKRTPETVEPYLDFNMEVLAQVYNTLQHEIGKDELTDSEIQALENGENFQKLYSYYLNKTNVILNDIETNGIWVKYEQGEDYQLLWKSLQGKNTGWCTAGEETCRIQVQQGDFYVYYTKDKEGNYTNPRIAIRMNGHDSIAEVRGISEKQNLEANMIEIAEKKLNEFSDAENYRKKFHDMKILTVISNKSKSNEDLSQDELRFLYEIDDSIMGFGFEKIHA